ncbi:alpha/beta hydrolase [Amphibacillus jilinensis]|uniref:alpha/beta hydrolase n=1 Tax=Amphibacillus jilinensis TaxID=1216008 RepID=UPI0002E0B0F7|nr:alpha/beta hydrolase-fold protein [Amphibacillus jilinensis]
MALLQVSYFSDAMQREVTFNALIPKDMRKEAGQKVNDHHAMKSLYLLHGYSGSFTDWLTYANVRELSERYQIAIFMPSGENHFYIDDTDKKNLYGEYIGAELVEYTRGMFPISDQKEDTFIGGLSMGGYGAIRNGLKYPENFGKIIALSSALITYNIQNASPDYADGVADYQYFTRVFGDLTKLKGSDKDPEALFSQLKKENKTIPHIYMACGSEDFLLDVNHKLRDFLNSENSDFTYVEAPGEHSWTFWNTYIEKALAWALQ